MIIDRLPFESLPPHSLSRLYCGLNTDGGFRVMHTTARTAAKMDYDDTPTIYRFLFSLDAHAARRVQWRDHV